MKGDHIRYRAGYKYQLVNDYRVQTDIRPDYNIMTEFIELDCSGVMLIRHGYAWDGPSNPIYCLIPFFILKHLIKTFMRGSLVHDVTAQLIRDGYLGEEWVTPSNRELKKICIEDGMTRIRAQAVFIGVEYLNNRSWAKYWSDGNKPLMNAP